MTRRLTAGPAVILAAAALTLGACGGDDEGDQAATGPAATETTTRTTETGTAGTTETGTTETRERERERKRDRDRGRGRRGRDGSKGGSGGSGSGGAGAQASPELNVRNAERTARKVCRDFLPPAIAREIESGKKDEEDFARDYARGFPEKLRDLAYDGCLAGLRSRER
jgi:hypothetical protein